MKSVPGSTQVFEMRRCVRIVDTVGRGLRPSAERKLPLRNSVENFRFAVVSALRHLEGYSYNRSDKYLHASVWLGGIAGDPARFRQFEWRNASSRTLLDVAVNGGTQFSRSS